MTESPNFRIRTRLWTRFGGSWWPRRWRPTGKEVIGHLLWRDGQHPVTVKKPTDAESAESYSHPENIKIGKKVWPRDV